MAERRMFTKKITDSDAFTTLPPTTQALYFHLCMNADDDGFNNKIRQAMFNSHADQNDLNLLVQHRFVIPFDEKGVVVIKHWRLHNIIRADRYHKTEYAEEMVEHKLKFSEIGQIELQEMIDVCVECYDLAIQAFVEGDREKALLAIEKERKADKLELQLRKKHIERVTKQECNTEAGIVFLDMVICLERISDHARNIADEVLDHIA